MPDRTPFLEVDTLSAGYGKRQIVFDVTLNVRAGEVVALIGHNGSGKSTLLKTVFGLLPPWRGRIRIDQRDVAGIAPRALLARGVTYVPQGNRLFGELSVRENLELGGIPLRDRNVLKERMSDVLQLFPVLSSYLSRQAAVLSGGQKQMTALARALITSPRLLLLDEPSLGLAAPLVKHTLERIRQLGRDRDIAILIVEQKVSDVLKIADRVYALRRGAVTYDGPAHVLVDDPTRLREVFL